MSRTPNQHGYLYLVGPVSCDYDEYDSFVVVAKTPTQARRLADEATYSHQKKAFLKADVENLGQANRNQKPGIVLGSFNAG